MLLEESFDDIIAVTALPAKYHRRLKTTNGIERINKEILRRERIICICSNTVLGIIFCLVKCKCR